MVRKFDPQVLLNERSPEQAIYQCIESAVRYAVLGYILHSVEIIELASQLGPLKLRYLYTGSFYFAWEAIDVWPSIVPPEHKTTEYLKNLDESETLSKWASPCGIRLDAKYEKIDIDEAGLDNLLEFIRGREEPQGMLRYAYNDNLDVGVTRAGAVSLALDIALRLDGHEDDVASLLSVIHHDGEYGNDVHAMERNNRSIHIQLIAKSECLDIVERWPYDGQIEQRRRYRRYIPKSQERISHTYRARRSNVTSVFNARSCVKT
jgi:hypothetical protein